jgi:hypothetical protein
MWGTPGLVTVCWVDARQSNCCAWDPRLCEFPHNELAHQFKEAADKKEQNPGVPGK